MRRLAVILMLQFAVVLSAFGFPQAWRFAKIQGSARSFAVGEWKPLDMHSRVYDADLQTAGDGFLTLRHDNDLIEVEPSSKVRLEWPDGGRTQLRVLDGGVAGAVSPTANESFVLIGASATFDVKGADFAMAQDGKGVSLTVTRGLVRAVDFATQQPLDVRAGQNYRSDIGHGGNLRSAAPGDPLVQSIQQATDQLAKFQKEDADAVDAEKSPAQSEDAAALEKLQSDGLMEGLSGGDAKVDDSSAAQVRAALHGFHGKKRRGHKADAQVALEVAKAARDMLNNPDDEDEPLASDFKWTEVVDGEFRLKPLSRILVGLQGAEAYTFWMGLLLICAILGAMTSGIMKQTGFGAFGNATLIGVAFAVAVLLRDLLFRSGLFIPLEPFLSLGLMLAAMPALLLGGAYLKFRSDL